MADNTEILQLLIDSSGAIAGAEEFDRAADKVAASSQNAAKSTDDLSESIERTTTTIQTSAREMRQQASALEQFRSSTDSTYSTTKNLEKGVTSLQAAQAALTRELQSGKISIPEYDAQLAVLQGRQAELTTTTAALRAGQISAADATSALVSPAEKAAAAAKAQAAEQAAQSAAVQALRDKLDPLSVAQRRYSDSVASADGLLKAGAITTAEHAAALDLAKVALDDFGKANEHAKGQSGSLREGLVLFHEMISGNYKRAVGSATIELQNLGYMQAIVTALTNPLVIATIGLVAAFGAAVVAGVQYSSANDALQKSFTAVGGVAGITKAQLGDYIDSVAQSAEISQISARTIAAEFIKTGKATSDSLASAVQATAALSRATGEDLATAEKDVAAALQNPIKAAQDLTSQYGVLTLAQLDQVRSLQNQNDKAGAAKIVTDALSSTLQSQQTSWQHLGAAISDAWNALGKWVDRAAHFDDLDIGQQIARIQAQIANAGKATPLQALLGIDPTQQEFVKKEIADLQAALDALIKKREDLANAANVQGDNKDAAEIQALVGSIDQESDAYDKLTGKLTQLVQFNLTNANANERTRIAQEAVTNAVSSYLTPVQRLNQEIALSNSLVHESAGARAVDKAAAEARLSVAGKEISSEEATARVTKATTEAINSQKTAIVDQSAVLSIQTAGIIKSGQAYLQSAAAGVQATAAIEAATAAYGNSQASVSQLTAENVQKYVNAQVQGASQTIISLGRQLDAQNALAAATVLGTTAAHDADVQNQINLTTADLEIAKTKAKTQAERDLIQAQEDKIASDIKGADLARQQTGAAGELDAEQQKVALLRQEIASGVTIRGQTDERLARVQRELELKRQYPDLDKQRISALADQYDQETKLTNQINQTRQATEEFIRDESQATKTLFDDALSDVFDHGLKGFKDFGGQVLQVMEKLAAEIATILIFHPEVDIASLLTGGGGIGGSGGGIGNILGLGKSIFGLFGSGSDPVTGLTDFGSGGASFFVPSFASDAAGGGGFLSTAFSNLGGAFGIGGSSSGGAGLLGGAAGGFGGVLGGAGAAFGAGNLIGHLIGTPGGGALGGAASGALIGTAILPGIGTIAGAIIGAIGGLLGGQKPTNASAQGVVNLHTGDLFDVNNEPGHTENVQGRDQLLSAIAAFAHTLETQTGGTLPGGIRVDAGSRDGLKLQTIGIPGQPDGGWQTFTDAKAALDFIEKALTHSLTGLSATMKTVLDHVADPSQLDAAIQFANALDALTGAAKDGGRALNQTQTAMKALAAQADTLQTQATQYGIDPNVVKTAFATQFNSQISDAFAQAAKPLQFALDDEKRSADARVDTATKLGADLTLVEKLNAQERLAIIQQYDASITDDMSATLSNAALQAKVVNDNIAAQIEQINNPQQYALDQLELQRKAAVDAAAKAGADVNLVETLYGLKRTQIVQQFAQQATQATQASVSAMQASIASTGKFISSLQDYLRGLDVSSASPLSPIDKYKAAKSQFESDASSAAYGDTAAQGRLTNDTSTFLSQSQAFNASGPQYAQDYAEVKSTLANTITVAQKQLDIQTAQLATLNSILAALSPASASTVSAANSNIPALPAFKETGALAPFSGLQPYQRLSSSDLGADFIRTYYQQDLGRSASDAEVQAWLNAGVSRAVFVQDVMNSPEALAMAKPHALGGMDSGWMLAGEKGPELINTSAPTRFYSADDTRKMFGGGGLDAASVAAITDRLEKIESAVRGGTMVHAQASVAVAEAVNEGNAVARKMASDSARAAAAPPRIAA
jgi:hypothetical protein